MTVYLAVQTKKLIDDMLEADQGNAWRGWLARVLPHMGDAYRSDEDGMRSHLGASQLGEECARRLWYGFRWATASRFNAQMLRLFNRGHLEEGRIIALLVASGIRVYQQDENGKQFRISFFGGHGGGSGDGRSDNIPDIPVGLWCALEFKTHKESSFTAVAGKEGRDRANNKIRTNPPGVIQGKPEHYIQCVLYMDGMGIGYTLYVAVNKDTDEIYMEILVANPELAAQYKTRGINIICLPTPPKRISESIAFWKCVYCEDKLVCHKKQPALVSCRSCQYSQPLEDGTWYCRLKSVTLSKEAQKAACDQYLPIDMSC